MKKKKLALEVINQHAAGIDVGSRSHYVAIGQRDEDVREFGVYAEDLKELTEWLLENKITSVAMESTGTYWQNLYSALQDGGIEVILVNGKFTKNISGKKTDVKDCKWLQKLHTIGLLTGSFLPDQSTEQLRTYCRHRTNLIETAACATRKMQHYLRLLNLRLDIVVKDITGLTGLRIIEMICKGETDSELLASLRHGNCRKSKEEIAKALQSNNRRDYLFGLQQELDLYKMLQMQMDECDREIEKMLNSHLEKDPSKKELRTDNKIHLSYQYFGGIDLMAIEGVSHSTVIALMSEVGLEGMKKFKSAKEFSSWLRLSPNNKISGGKVLSNKIPKGSNRLKIALRNAANAIGNLKDTHLSNFFKRIAFRKGRTSAISATARKLAVIIWNMITHHIQYAPPTQYEFLDQKRKRKVQEMKKLIHKFDITPTDLGLQLNTNQL
jgi:transposase